MNIKQSAGYVGRVVLLAVVLFVIWALAGALTGTSRMSGEVAPGEQSDVAGALLAVCLLDSAVFTYIGLRSRASGWPLAGIVFLGYFGITGVMSLVEAQVFMPHVLPPGTLPRLYANAALVGALLSVSAVTLLGRWRKGAESGPAGGLERVAPAFGLGVWMARLALIAAAYVALYYSFGYLVAWQSPAVRQYYSGVRIPAWAPLLQVVRALLWTAIAFPVVRTMRGRGWEAGLATGLLFAVVMNAPHLLPNPFMPRPVQLAHLVETGSSNFIFGWLVAWALRGTQVRRGRAAVPSFRR